MASQFYTRGKRFQDSEKSTQEREQEFKFKCVDYKRLPAKKSEGGRRERN